MSLRMSLLFCVIFAVFAIQCGSGKPAKSGLEGSFSLPLRRNVRQIRPKRTIDLDKILQDLLKPPKLEDPLELLHKLLHKEEKPENNLQQENQTTPTPPLQLGLPYQQIYPLPPPIQLGLPNQQNPLQFPYQYGLPYQQNPPPPPIQFGLPGQENPLQPPIQYGLPNQGNYPPPLPMQLELPYQGNQPPQQQLPIALGLPNQDNPQSQLPIIALPYQDNPPEIQLLELPNNDNVFPPQPPLVRSKRSLQYESNSEESLSPENDKYSESSSSDCSSSYSSSASSSYEYFYEYDFLPKRRNISYVEDGLDNNSQLLPILQEEQFPQAVNGNNDNNPTQLFLTFEVHQDGNNGSQIVGLPQDANAEVPLVEDLP